MHINEFWCGVGVTIIFEILIDTTTSSAGIMVRARIWLSRHLPSFHSARAKAPSCPIVRANSII